MTPLYLRHRESPTALTSDEYTFCVDHYIIKHNPSRGDTQKFQGKDSPFVLMVGQQNAQAAVRHAPETFHFRRKVMHDSIWVQEHHNYVNDDEEHEANPHLEDFLVPHHSVHIESDGGGGKECHPSSVVHSAEPNKPTLDRPCQSILHKVDCSSRQQCEVTEARRLVMFDKVTVRDYAMILGDHPNCRMGPPVTIEWDYMEYEPLSVNEYEIHHSLRRPLKQLYLKAQSRKEMLKSTAGHSLKEMNLAVAKVKRVQRRRKLTTEMSHTGHRAHEALESLIRKVKRRLNKAN